MHQNQRYNECPVCGQGELLVVQDLSTTKFLIMCDDCESTWEDPESSLDFTKCLDRTDSKVRDATQQEIKELGWLQYIK